MIYSENKEEHLLLQKKALLTLHFLKKVNKHIFNKINAVVAYNSPVRFSLLLR